MPGACDEYVQELVLEQALKVVQVFSTSTYQKEKNATGAKGAQDACYSAQELVMCRRFRRVAMLPKLPKMPKGAEGAKGC